jgi:hypothetical protein
MISVVVRDSGEEEQKASLEASRACSSVACTRWGRDWVGIAAVLPLRLIYSSRCADARRQRSVSESRLRAPRS